jgi:DNA uptake protein ComE-like DNA-binding protein
MNSVNTDSPAARLASRGWRLRHSAWTLAPIFGFGLLSFVGFVYVACRVREKRWWLIAAVFCLLTALAWTLMEVAEGSDGEVSGGAAGVVVGVWAASIIYAFILNRDYLKWRARQNAATAWYNQPETGQHTAQPSAARNQGAHAPAPAPVLGVDPSAYYAPTPTHAAPPTATPPPVAHTPQQVAAHRVDINTAPESAIAAVPGLDAALAARVAQERARRGHFSSIDDLVVVGLQPHQMVRARDHLVFSRPTPTATPDAPRPAGRILDI